MKDHDARVVSESELLAELQSVFRDVAGGRSDDPIDRETRFFADLGLASIDAVVLGEAIQQHFERPIPFSELMADLGRRGAARPGHRRADRLPSSSTLAGTGRRVFSEVEEQGHAPNQGERLVFHVQQAGTGPDVVLIHGLTGDLSIWFLSRAMPSLGETHRVTAYDLRGHGYSDAPATDTRRSTMRET